MTEKPKYTNSDNYIAIKIVVFINGDNNTPGKHVTVSEKKMSNFNAFLGW